ncbi:MAG: OstA-like protein [Bacteroidota bacterium]
MDSKLRGNLSKTELLLYRVFIGFVWFACLLPSYGVGQVPTQALPSDSTQTDSAQTKRVQILHADRLSFQKGEEDNVQKLIGHVRLKQDSTFFFCDSAYLYEVGNRLEAFNRVKIVMPDSTILRSEKLIYEAETRVAKVYDNIRLTDGDVELETDQMTYYREEEYGFYERGGILRDRENTLSSQLGYYYAAEDMAYFRNSVRLENEDFTLDTDTLGYNTETEVAFFLTYTTILSEDGEIETSRGRYDTEAKKVYLYEQSTVRDSNYVLIADTLFYDEGKNFGQAFSNVEIEQDDSTLMILGEYGEFNRKTDESMITRDAVAIQFMDDDTLYMFADTLRYVKAWRLTKAVPVDSIQQNVSLVDSLVNATGDSLALEDLQLDADSSVIAIEDPLPVADSLISPPIGSDSLNLDSLSVADEALVFDSTSYKLFKAYGSVRFFMGDMQGRTDSLLYFFEDSIIHLLDDPVLWSEQNQITGDTMKIWIRNQQVDSMWIGADGFLVSQEEEVGFNQIKGKQLRAKFADNELVRLHVIGNSESIYFARDDSDSTATDIKYHGMNKALAQQMTMYFTDNEPTRIVFTSKPEGTFYPFYQIVNQPNKIDGMKWRISERPDRPRIFDPSVLAEGESDEATSTRKEVSPTPQSDSASEPQDAQNR